MVPPWEFKNYEAGELCSQLDRPVTMRWSEYAETHGRQPNWLYHCTHRTAAEQIAKDRAIYETDDSKPGDAFLGDGVYMTAMPVPWANPDVVKANNWGKKNARKIENWNKVNAYVRVKFEKIWDAYWSEIVYKDPGDWQSNFCVKTRAGVLYLTKEIDAEIWFHSSEEGRSNGELPELYWSAKGGYTPFSRMTRKKHTVRPGNEEMKYIYGRGWVVDRAPKKTKYTRDAGPPRVEVGNGYIRTTSIPDWAGPPGGW